jgi:penicillin-binding protein 1A
VEPATLPDHALQAQPPSRPPSRSRLKKLRFLLIFLALALLGVVSFVFGMFMAVASDLPELENSQQYDNARNSVLLDDRGREIGMLSEHDQILVAPSEIPPIVKEAVISIEDRRFRTNSGIDLRSVARAFVDDVLHQGAVQGASTIEQQFVKNALQEQSHRTIFEKLREAALAFHLDHRWSKEKIITEYLNTIYFGNGAYGVEAAARTYFGQDVNHLGCGTPRQPLCVSELQPAEAALLAGIIQSPTGYDPVTEPAAARARRDLVLWEMLKQGYVERPVYEEAVAQALPAAKDIVPPEQPLVDGVDTGYFDGWVGQQAIERYGAGRAFDGGLEIRTTLDLDLQRAAEQAIDGYLPGPEGPSAALVAIENSTGKVRAMVGGRDYDESPFNLATEGERQPGSSFKAFDLAGALEDGISPDSVWASREKTFRVPDSSELFVVHNDENAYTGENTLTGATAYSDNSIYAEVGLKVGTRRIAALAHRMGITTPISTNPAMTIGGLKVGVTPLDMAHAYETIAHGGERVSGTLGEAEAPVGIEEVDGGGRTLFDGRHREVDHTILHRVLPPSVASTETEVLETVLQYGTGRAAALGQFAAGKTGTTSNYGDAWFVGWDSRFTVAVWVGFPNSLIPMTTDFDGGPVLGGTFPALIWHDFMESAMRIESERVEEASARRAAARAAHALTTTTTREAPEAPSGATAPGGVSSGQSSTRAQETSQPPQTHGGSPSSSGGGPASRPGIPAPAQEGGGAGSPNPAQSPQTATPGGGAGGGVDGRAGPPSSTPATPTPPTSEPSATQAPGTAAPKVSGGTGAPTGGTGAG